MDMFDHSLWGVFAILGVLLLLSEMASGTLYFLILGSAMLLTALFEFIFRAGMAWDMVALGILCAAGVYGVYRWHKKHDVQTSQSYNAVNLNSNIGQIAIVERLTEDGSAQVAYRGSLWAALLEADENGKRVDFDPNAYVKGTRVQIVDQKANTLYVKPLD